MSEPGMMARESLEYLVALGKDVAQTRLLLEDSDSRTYLITNINGNTEIKTFQKEPPLINHKILTLKGFADYINKTDDSNTIIFVDENEILADFNVNKNHKYRAYCPLTPTKSFKCLQQLFSGAAQKQLWRMLVTELDGCFDPSLECYIGSIQFSESTEKKIEISNAGLINGTANRAQRINFQPTSNSNIQSVDIPMNWLWKGKIWDCFDSVAEINLRLEIENDDGKLIFIFHPKSLEEMIRAQKELLVDQLKELVDVLIYQGSL